MTDPTYIALCAGGGLGCEGFRQAGWRLEAAVEWDRHRQRLLKLRFPEAIVLADLRAVRAKDLPRVDCWFASTPCVDFSLSGKRKGLDGVSGQLALEVFRLYREAQSLVKEPRFLLFENVRGLLSKTAHWPAIQDAARAVVLVEVVADVLDSRRFGVPQQRERVFAMWSSEAFEGELPTLSTVPWRSFARSEMPDQAWGAPVPAERLRRALDKVARRGGPGILRRLRQFAGFDLRPSCWREKIVVYCDHSRSSVAVGQANTLTKTSRLMSLDPDHQVVMLRPEGWEWLMGAPVGFTDGAGLSCAHRQQVCGDGICVPVARAVGEWIKRLL